MTAKIRIATAAILLLLLQNVAEATPWYKSWKWWVGEAVIAGSLAADAHSTVYGISHCPSCKESNSFIGPHPSTLDIASLSAIGFGMETGFHILGRHVLKDDPSPAWQVISYTAIPALNVAIFTPGIIRNYGLSAGKASSSSTAATVILGQVPSRPAQTFTPWGRNLSTRNADHRLGVNSFFLYKAGIQSLGGLSRCKVESRLGGRA